MTWRPRHTPSPGTRWETEGRARPRVVVVGAGFGGLAVVRHLRRAPVDTLLLDQHNYHLFYPLLYQVASALLDPAEVAYPTRAILRRQSNADFRLGQVAAVDLAAHLVVTDRGPVGYDYLVLATGSVNHFFGLNTLKERAHDLKSLDGALALRNQVLRCFEEAQWTEDATRRRRLLSFAIVGGGSTGVEFAGALSELVRLVLRRDFPRLDAGDVNVHLVEAAHDILALFAPSLRTSARRRLARMHVQIHLDTPVREASDGEILIGQGERLEAATVIWTGGVRASELGASLGLQLGRSGQVPVRPTLQLDAHPEVFVVGDLAEVRIDGAILPMLAPVAIQAGEQTARNLIRLCHGESPQPFRYRDHGTMATIGRNAAVAQLGPLHLAGFAGWVTWLFVHLALLIGFRNRLVTMVNWAWEYLLRDHPIRIIATREPEPLPHHADDAAT